MYTRQHGQPEQRYYCQNDTRTDRWNPHHNLPVLQEYVAVKAESQAKKERTTAGAVMIFSVCRKANTELRDVFRREKIQTKKAP
jgi:hypothetical protein